MPWVGLAGLGLLAGTVVLRPDLKPGVIYAHTKGYHHIRVVTDSTQEARLLYLDSTVEGAMLPGSINPGLPYQRVIGRLARAVPMLERVFFIGGSFSMPKYVHATMPDARVEVAEVDTDVTRVARAYLELPKGLKVLNQDGRRALAQLDGASYGLIVNDAFHGVRNVPFHLLTHEFAELVGERLAPLGLYAVNIASNGPDSVLLKSVTMTLQTVFKHVTWLGVFKSPTGLANTWVLASHAPLVLGEPIPMMNSEAQVLTDDDAPIEYMVARELLRGRDWSYP